MKTKLLLLVIVSILLTSSTCMQKKKIVFFGDSITQGGVEPKGYITILSQLLAGKNNKNDYELIGAGISGNKVYDLYLRYEEDVLAKKPDAVVIWIGVNDVWHKQILHTGTDADKFEDFYLKLISKFKEKNIDVYVATPAVVGEKWDGTNILDADLDKYSEIIRKVAKQSGSTLVDLRKEFLDHLKSNNQQNKEKGILTYDGVHLNDAGNSFVAEKMYEVLSSHFIKQ